MIIFKFGVSKDIFQYFTCVMFGPQTQPLPPPPPTPPTSLLLACPPEANVYYPLISRSSVIFLKQSNFKYFWTVSHGCHKPFLIFLYGENKLTTTTRLLNAKSKSVSTPSIYSSIRRLSQPSFIHPTSFVQDMLYEKKNICKLIVLLIKIIILLLWLCYSNNNILYNICINTNIY